MLNNAIPAAAPGLPKAMMPDLARRRILLGLAVASTAAAGAAMAPALAEVPEETRELVRLGEGLDSLYREYAEARAVVDRIVRLDPWPEPPAEIIAPEGYCEHYFERDVTEGARHIHRGDVGRRAVLPSGCFHGNVETARDVLRENRRYMQRSKTHGPAYWRTKLEAAEKAIPLAEAYEAACIKAREASGYEPARVRLRRAIGALCDHVGAMLDCEERGMGGIVLKARVRFGRAACRRQRVGRRRPQPPGRARARRGSPC
jgi:hypothetical protein